ncbi:MAG: hypothetical protein GY805_19140 [Chloroflexi bacterium]|nr:hypothetical protein [Chloroflexota bacterium]
MLRDKSRIGLCLALGAYFPLATFTILTLFAATTARYSFMSLPFWIVLTAVGLSELYKQIQTDKRALLWLLGLPILLLRDPAIEDTLYHLSRKPAFAIFFIFILLTGLLGIFWFYQRNQTDERRLSQLWLPLVLFILLAHPIIADGLYFAYQGGYRDNWKGAAALVQREKGAGDIIVTAIPPIINYYLSDNAQNIRQVNVDEVLQNGRRLWIVEDFGLEQWADPGFYEWAETNCRLSNDWDQYVSGYLWKMRVYRCEPTS